MPDLLAIYVNDHLAAAAGESALARRVAGSRSGAVADDARRLAAEVSDDRDALVAIARRLGVRRTVYKESFALAAERLGRFKPNGAVIRRSTLSDVVEYEALAVAITAKRRLWQTLRRLAETRTGLDAAELEELIRSADGQLDTIERLHGSAVAEAFDAA
jgi:hypothetical protein